MVVAHSFLSEFLALTRTIASAFPTVCRGRTKFSASSNQYNATGSDPAAILTFDISPLVILVFKDNMPLYHFLTSLCAVVGGVFTVIGLVDFGIFHAMNSIK